MTLCSPRRPGGYGSHSSQRPPALFADIVFDRPLDHAFTYAVPDDLAHKIGVGKRRRAPFGKGGTFTAGFCVRVSEAPPASDIHLKSIVRVIDDDALVDDHLMKLTRWMADYYLCSWGHVLHAVVPAGVRENAGTRLAAFVESAPPDQLPNPLPGVTPTQKKALEVLKSEARPMEVNQLCRMAKIGTGVIAGLIKKVLGAEIQRADRNRRRRRSIGLRCR